MSRTPRTMVLLVPLLAALAGCAGTHTEMISESRAPVPAESVRVYFQRPPGSVDIAMLDATSGIGFGTQGQRDAVIARLKREAAKLGANGVLLLGGGRGDSGVGIGVGAGSYGSHGGVSVGGGIPTTQEHANGIAIHVPEGSLHRAAPLSAPQEPMQSEPSEPEPLEPATTD